MVTISKPDLMCLINHLADGQENLNECLIKIEAMAQVATTTNFLDLSESVVYNYLWALSDVISHAKNINDRLLAILLKEKTVKI